MNLIQIAFFPLNINLLKDPEKSIHKPIPFEIKSWNPQKLLLL